jgi:hypothetical protein
MQKILILFICSLLFLTVVSSGCIRDRDKGEEKLEVNRFYHYIIDIDASLTSNYLLYLPSIINENNTHVDLKNMTKQVGTYVEYNLVDTEYGKAIKVRGHGKSEIEWGIEFKQNQHFEEDLWTLSLIVIPGNETEPFKNSHNETCNVYSNLTGVEVTARFYVSETIDESRDNSEVPDRYISYDYKYESVLEEGWQSIVIQRDIVLP